MLTHIDYRQAKDVFYNTDFNSLLPHRTTFKIGNITYDKAYFIQFTNDIKKFLIATLYIYNKTANYNDLTNLLLWIKQDPMVNETSIFNEESMIEAIVDKAESV